MPAAAVSLPESVAANLASWGLYPENLLKSVSSYLASRVEFSGDSHHSRDAASGRLNLAGNNLIWSSHDIALDFRDSVSRSDGGESQTLLLRYSFPVAGSRFRITLEDSEHAGVVDSSGQRYNAHGEYRGVTLSGSRSFWSWRGVELDSVFSHSTSTNRAFEDSVWVSDSTRQLSSFGIRCAGQHEVPGGFLVMTDVTALGGTEYRETASRNALTRVNNQFHKLALSASLGRSLYTWDLDVVGRYQFAPEDLVSSEDLQIAGSSMMQGFNGQSLYVSEGGWVRMNARSPGYSLPYTDTVNSHVMFSVLKGWAPSSGSSQDRFSASAGEIALRLQGQGFHASMSVGRILDLSGPSMEQPSAPDVSLSMSMRI